MDDALKELSSYRIDKAKEDLKSAKINFDNGLFAQSINRSYYAIFHATRSLLAFDRFDSKKHSGIIAYFNQHYIKTGKLDVKYGKMLKNAEEIRNDSDYNDFFLVSKEQAENQIRDAEEFVRKIEDYIGAVVMD